MNVLKTGMLLAALTALFMGVGYLVGGTGGAFFAFLLAAGMNLFSYWNADRMVLRMHRAKEVDQRAAPELYGLVGELSHRAGLPMPKVYLIDSPQPNAFATGRNPENAAVAATTGILRTLTREELAGVIGHELTHVKNRDTLTMTIAATIAGAISMIANFAFFFGGLGGNNRNNPFGIVGVLLAAITAPIAAMLIQMAISRTREYSADRGGAAICGNPLWLASALAKIEGAAKRAPLPSAEMHPATAPLFIINPLTGERMDNLFSTHPATANRIAALEAMARSGNFSAPRPAATNIRPTAAPENEAPEAGAHEPAPVGSSPWSRAGAAAGAALGGESRQGIRAKRAVHQPIRPASEFAAPRRPCCAKSSSGRCRSIPSSTISMAIRISWRSIRATGRSAARSSARRSAIAARSTQPFAPRSTASSPKTPNRSLPSSTSRRRRSFSSSIPDHAAVNLAVTQAAGDRRTGRARSLVNAVLRRLVRDREEILARPEAYRLNTPAWLFARWRNTYGDTDAGRIAAAHREPTGLDLSVKSDPARWAETLGGTLLPTGTVRLAVTERVFELPGYAEGAWWVQDAAAALPARLLGDVAGKSVADLCAAPGGKTAELAAAGATVTAIDLSQGRLRRLSQNLARLKLSAELKAADILTFEPGEAFDAVLLDAPCTSTGTIRRHPDIAWLKRPEDVTTLAALQAKMLDRAVAWVKPGGLLVFCTCSLEPEEGPEHMAAFLKRHPDCALLPISPAEISGLTHLVTPEGVLRTRPCDGFGTGPAMQGMDGFFAARFRRL